MANSSATTASTGDQKSVDLRRSLAKLEAWRDAEREAAAARARADRLKDEFRAAMSALGAEVGKVGNTKVLSYTATDNFPAKRFTDERPDLAEHYTVTKTVKALDLEALKAEMPDVFEQYRSRSMRPDWKAVDRVLDSRPTR